MASTIYTPQNPSPRNEVRDMILAQIFSVIIDGVRCTDYQIRIYRVSDNVLVHDSTKLNLATPLADGETLEHTLTGGTISNTGTDSYKWTIQVWNDTETVASREFQFFAKTTPVLTFSPPVTITAQSYEFTATLTQAEGDIVNNYTFELYDSDDELIEDSGLITSFNIKHTFEGFANSDTFKVRLYGTTTGNDSFDSGLISFNISYSEPSLTIVPDATVDNDTSLVTINRSEVVQIIGSGTGTIQYTNNIFTFGDTVLQLDTSSDSVSFDVDIPLDFSLKFKWKPISTSFTGVICQLDNGVYEVSYETGRFKYTINGITIYTSPISLETNRVFYLVLLPTEVKFKYADV